MVLSYEGHVQNIGWQKPVTVTGDQDINTITTIAGTTGQAKRIEAIGIELVKTDVEKVAEIKAVDAVTTG